MTAKMKKQTVFKLSKLPETIKKAYEKTGFKPLTRGWARRNRCQACPLAILKIAYYDNIKCRSYQTWADNLFGKDFVTGFTAAIDGHNFDSFDQNYVAYSRGYRIGTKVAQKLGLNGENNASNAM